MVGTRRGRNAKDLEEYFEDLYNLDFHEQVVVHMYGFDGIRRGN